MGRSNRGVGRTLVRHQDLFYRQLMAAKVLFVTPSNAPAGYFVSFSERTSALELGAEKSKAKVFVDDLAAREQRATIMRAQTSDGRHVALAVSIQNS